MKIRNRLTVTLSLTAFISVSALGLAVYFFTCKFHEQQFFARLEERVRLTELMLLEKNEEVTQAVRDKFLQTLDEEEEYAITLQKSGLDSLDSLFRVGLSVEVQSGQAVPFWQKERQGVARKYELPHGNFAVVVTATDIFGQTKLAHLRQILLAGVLLCLLLQVLVAWQTSRRALLPLEDQIHKASVISANRLDLRLQIRNPDDELGELAVAFNRMLERLQASFNAQRHFVSNASHELRNPLTAIIGEAEVLLSRPRSNEEYREALEVIQNEAGRLEKLTTALLDLAKAEALQALPNPKPLALDDCLMRLLERFPVQRLDLQLPDFQAPLMVQGNDTLLSTAIGNVLDNALKYSGEQPVQVALYDALNGYLLKITDRGIGIPAEDMDKIFQPLFRSKNVQGIQGIGVGLPLAQKIVRLHGGTLEVQSKEGGGTSVAIFLPRHF